MANKDNPGTPPKQSLQQDALVERLVPDPGKRQPTVQLTGWLGKSTEDGTWLLYLTPQLDDYVQFSENDVVHSQALPTKDSPLGGTVVWLHAETPLQHIQVLTRQAQAGFLSGDITSAYMAGASSSLPAATSRRPTGAAAINYTANWHIPACAAPTANCYHTQIYPCTIEPINCGSRNAFCNSREFVC
jgi:hypothetical protein